MADITTKFLRQTACYWGAPVSDGYNGFTFADPIEIPCRWTDSVQVVSDGKGNDIVCKSVVMVAIDLQELGMLFLGTLDDLDSAQEDDPVSIPNCYAVKRFDRVPLIRGDKFLRVAYL
jgi:hypothetical protein